MKPAQDTKEILDLLRKTAKVACLSARVPEMEDDLVQELYLLWQTILERWDPEKGELSAYVYGYAQNVLHSMKDDRIEYIGDDTELAVDELADHDPFLQKENEIDIERAKKRVQAKLSDHGLHEVDFKPYRSIEKKSPKSASRSSELDEIIKSSGLKKTSIARALRISPQLLNAYIKGHTKEIPQNVVNAILLMTQHAKKSAAQK